jgi:hypothetical protein
VYEWSRKLCVIAGETRPNDWSVLHHGKIVGRVKKEHDPFNDAKPWCWSNAFPRSAVLKFPVFRNGL